MADLTHFDSDGRPVMVDVSDKPDTKRTALASGRIFYSREVFEKIKSGSGTKGDFIKIAEIAGIMGAKKTPDLIPLCHQIPISNVTLSIEPENDDASFIVTGTVRTTGKTGVEMEALTAVSIACLTIYDMTKALDKSMVISDIKLVEKSGGKSGDFKRQ